MVIYNIPKQ
jgi:hypothetical protein